MLSDLIAPPFLHIISFYINVVKEVSFEAKVWLRHRENLQQMIGGEMSSEVLSGNIITPAARHPFVSTHKYSGLLSSSHERQNGGKLEAQLNRGK